MDVLTRYAESDSTKDPSSDDDKSGKGKKNGGGKGQQQNNSVYNGNHGNQGNGARCKHSEGGSDFVANTNTSFKVQRWNNSGRSFNGIKLTISRKQSKPPTRNTAPRIS